MFEIPIQIINCPSRRPAILLPFGATVPYNTASMPTTTIATDYAACGGDRGWDISFPVPSTFAEADDPSFEWEDVSDRTGISFVRSRVTTSKVTDGLARTYMVGEKYVNPDRYLIPLGRAGDDNAYNGHDWHTVRYGAEVEHGQEEYSALAPLQDMHGFNASDRFGSAHPSGFHMALGDGSVHAISYDIDTDVHRYLSNRKDGIAVDLSEIE